MMIKYKIFRYFDYLSYKKKRTFWEALFFSALSAARGLKYFFKKTDNLLLSKSYLSLNRAYRNLTKDGYRFVSFEDAISLVDSLVSQIGERFDLIVGIPRSGLFVANIIALKLGAPLAPSDVPQKIWKSKLIKGSEKIKNILLVDDSIVSGTTMKREVETLIGHYPKARIVRVALVATEETKGLVDYYATLIPKPRVFEWNMMHAKRGSVAVDMDGVLCENPPAGITRYEDLYLNWLKSAKPYLIPVFEIDQIISNRLEKHRAETEKWLRDNRVIYRELLLSPADDKAGQKRMASTHKINNLIIKKPSIYWESEEKEAREIAKETGLPVLCIETKDIYG